MGNLQLKSTVFGGTLFSTVANIQPHDVYFTIIMAVIGAVVSFFVSLLLKWISGKL
ncbi:hypothetical protein [Ochrovirga pacifica]|uniref:hypothetical protein n=1 Tax=Ochrovirga pacifica TaxID=1042376 RepID=UPI0002E854A4|nr:hypothetical protein [Ochrovirga pacifica]